MTLHPPSLSEYAHPDYGRGFSGFVDEIAWPTDCVLLSLGGDLDAYEKLLRDDQVHTAFQQRRHAVVSSEWEVVAGGTSKADLKARDFIEQQLQNISFDQVCSRMLYGVLYGYGVAECLYARDGQHVVLDALKVRKPKRFRFDIDGRLRLVDGHQGKSKPLPDNKFWTFTSGAQADGEYYGRGLGHWLYWPVFMKRNGVKFWAVTLEKFGSPTAMGRFPLSASDDDKARLLEAAAAVATEAAVVIPDGMDLTLLEAVRSSGGSHETFCAYMDKAITKVILGQTMTTENGSSRAQAEVHMGVRRELVRAMRICCVKP